MNVYFTVLIWYSQIDWFNNLYSSVSFSSIMYVFIVNYVVFKATFSVHKLIPKNAQMTNLYTNWSLYITFTMIYYIRQE